MRVNFQYKNHRGEIAEREVEFIGLIYVRNPGYGYQPGWFLHGICQKKQEVRSFALTHIILPDTPFYLLEPS